jgi:hypothetical protein
MPSRVSLSLPLSPCAVFVLFTINMVALQFRHEFKADYASCNYTFNLDVRLLGKRKQWLNKLNEQAGYSSRTG